MAACKTSNESLGKCFLSQVEHCFNVEDESNKMVYKFHVLDFSFLLCHKLPLRESLFPFQHSLLIEDL